MESSLARLRLRWNLLRTFSAALVLITYLVILLAIPNWWAFAVPALILGAVTTVLAMLQWKRIWIWVTILTQGFVFAIGLVSTLLGVTGASGVSILLLAFPMILISEHVLSVALNYSGQFSEHRNRSVMEFNANALTTSIDYAYKRLAQDGLLFGVAFLGALSVAAASVVSPAIAGISDPSVYVIVASISLALLIAFKQD